MHVGKLNGYASVSLVTNCKGDGAPIQKHFEDHYQLQEQEAALQPLDSTQSFNQAELRTMPSHDADKLEGLVFWCWEYSGCFARNPRTYNFISKDKKLTQPWQLLWQPCHDEVLLPPKLNFKVAHWYGDLSGMTYLMLLAMRTSFLDRCKNKTNPLLTLLQDLVFPVVDSLKGFTSLGRGKNSVMRDWSHAALSLWIHLFCTLSP